MPSVKSSIIVRSKSFFHPSNEVASRMFGRIGFHFGTFLDAAPLDDDRSRSNVPSTREGPDRFGVGPIEAYAGPVDGAR